MRPSVSVVIPAYNLARYLSQAIDSVLAQSRPASEIIVVDDGSSDETPEVLTVYGDRIRVLRHENRGLSAARNAGAATAHGDLLAFLDADDIWMPTKLEKQVARFEADAEVGLVHCGVEEIDGLGNVIGRRLDGLEGRVSEDMLLFERGVILGGGSGCVMLRSLFEQVGGCDLRLSTSADWDLYYRIARLRSVAFVAETLLRYRFHASNMHANIAAMEHDMMTAYRDAFDAREPSLRKIRRRCYGNLHAVLAGSYFRAGRYGSFLRHVAKTLWFRPANVSRFLGYPVRRHQRRATEREAAGSPSEMGLGVVPVRRQGR